MSTYDMLIAQVGALYSHWTIFDKIQNEDGVLTFYLSIQEDKRYIQSDSGPVERSKRIADTLKELGGYPVPPIIKVRYINAIPSPEAYMNKLNIEGQPRYQILKVIRNLGMQK